MPHMIPQYVREDFFTGEGLDGSVSAPADVFRDADDFATSTGCDRDTVEVVRDHVWARLSAPGYLDATEWLGPFDTLAEAGAELAELYDVDADTGEALDSTLADPR